MERIRNSFETIISRFKKIESMINPPHTTAHTDRYQQLLRDRRLLTEWASNHQQLANPIHPSWLNDMRSIFVTCDNSIVFLKHLQTNLPRGMWSRTQHPRFFTKKKTSLATSWQLNKLSNVPPPKTNMDPTNDGSQKESPLPVLPFQVPC